MSRLLPFGLLLLVLLASGCASPSSSGPAGGPGGAGATTSPDAVVHVYSVRIRVTQETPSGVPMAGADLYVIPKADATQDASKLPFPQITNAAGEVELKFPEPTTILVQAMANGKGWTREGLQIEVGEQALVDGVAQRDAVGRPLVILPLLHAESKVNLTGTWTTTLVPPHPDGTPGTAFTTVEIPLPADADVRELYLRRLKSADLELAWDNTATGTADLRLGLAWDDKAVWTEGAAEGAPQLSPGAHVATLTGALPDERPTGAGLVLRAAIITHTAVAGDLPFGVSGVLRFDGHVPAGIPTPSCLPVLLC